MGFVDREGGKGHFMYSVRLSIDSFWKVGVKRGLCKGFEGGDVAVFVAGLTLLNVVYEKRRVAVPGAVGKGVGWLRGEKLFVEAESEEEKPGLGKED